MMDIELKEKENISADIKLSRIFTQFALLLSELKKKELSPNIEALVTESVEKINASPLFGNDLKKLIKQQETTIIKQVEKEHKYVPKSYYQKLWMILGMTAFGLPMGVAFGISMGNMGLLGIGLPIGMGIGVAVGTGMDKKALKEGRQLDVEIKY